MIISDIRWDESSERLQDEEEEFIKRAVTSAAWRDTRFVLLILQTMEFSFLFFSPGGLGIGSINISIRRNLYINNMGNTNKQKSNHLSSSPLLLSSPLDISILPLDVK